MDNNTNSSNSNSNSGDRHAGLLFENLPSEQDRKAVIGCLAAVLNIMFAARQRKAIIAASTPAPASAPVADHVEDAALMTEGAATAVNFSIRQQDGDKKIDASTRSISRSTKAQQQQQKRVTQRTKAFQRELLNVSAELLFLSPDHAKVFLPNLDIQCADETAEQEFLLQPFLQSLSNCKESFRCIALLMFRFLLLSSEEKPKTTEKKKTESEGSAVEKMTIIGYDSRVRFAFKYLSVSILSFWELEEHGAFMMPKAASAHATRKFEALEGGIALRLSILTQIMMQEKNKKGNNALSGQKKQSTFGQSAIRGLKIGAAGVAAGTVFAITGGLAAPAIVGGIAALTGISSAATVVATILLLPAATTIFGVGGGTLVANKMSKRTAGLNEFDIEKITPDNEDGVSSGTDGTTKSIAKNNNPELSRTICISGWLRDEHDFERPFGITPRALTDHLELLCRYCYIYAPHIIPHCSNILKEWQGKEDELWDMCKASYGKDPSSLLPLQAGPRYDALLTENENAAVDELIRAMGMPFPTTQSIGQCSSPQKANEPLELPPTVNLLSDVLVSNINDEKSKQKLSDVMLRSYKAWDFNAEYESELYVIRWEKDLLLDLQGSAKAFQKDLAKKAAGEALKKTAMASLMAAVFLPAALLSLSNIIDEQWTLVAERSDEAGILLAQSLLNSSAGHRPVSLIGYSFGARMIIACLKELARNQAIWELQHEGEEEKEERESYQSKAASFRKSISNMSNKQKEAQVNLFSREPASIVEDVILMGCPASVNKATWLACRDVVGGRLVNCFSHNDMILALMYRAKNLTSTLLSPPVGISNVDVPGIENYDVSGFVGSHGEYCVAVREILNMVGYNQPVHLQANAGSPPMDEATTMD